MKKSNFYSSELKREDWVTKNLILLSNDPRERSIGIEENMGGGENVFLLFDSVSKSSKDTTLFVPPLVEDEEADEDDLPLRWSVQKQRG